MFIVIRVRFGGNQKRRVKIGSTLRISHETNILLGRFSQVGAACGSSGDIQDFIIPPLGFLSLCTVMSRTSPRRLGLIGSVVGSASFLLFFL